MPAHSSRVSASDESAGIISPFAQTTSSIAPERKSGPVGWPVRILVALLVFVVIGNSGYFGYRYLNNPYRTLEPFSVDKYYADFLPLTGNKFRAEMKVAADLGWKEGSGRLMVFTMAGDPRPVGVLIPPKFSGIFFTKGQTFELALEVSEGGLLYADSCEKE